ncbi:hypothetical protein FZEAL_5647 [Fusarium zealandicum]|uniref:Uncharacterized protein n=1 Tax=Fusarium zealandicum TaxID=1053134 RepID=A0A8H4UK86_9HYPO|nr:hypothetical protein FZEAL_5647 [Fusarium zealandicum]
MAFYFQPPIFNGYLVPPQTLFVPMTYTTSPFNWQLVPAAVPVPRTVVLPSIRLKIVFHRAGNFLGASDVVFHYPPAREILLGNIAYWSRESGLGDRVYAGQVTLVLTSSFLSPLILLPGTGPLRPAHAVRIMSLAQQCSVWEFEAVLAEIATRDLGAFLVVDVDAFAQIHQLTTDNGPPVQQQIPLIPRAADIQPHTPVTDPSNSPPALSDDQQQRQPADPNTNDQSGETTPGSNTQTPPDPNQDPPIQGDQDPNPDGEGSTNG